MRFPIITKQDRFGTSFANLSDALQDSLQDMGIINTRTHEAKQNYFDLPIEEGALLGFLSKFFDLTGDFHVGCTADYRPPSFGFYVGRGDMHTREGAFSLGYNKELKLSVFLENSSFRNKRHVRDLEALAEAYNQQETHTEQIRISWTGWVGKEDPVFGKTGFYSTGISAEFDGTFLKKLKGIDNFDEEKFAFESPLDGRQTPFHRFGRGTRLTEILEKYHGQKDELKHHNPQFMHAYNLPVLGYAVADVMSGMIQVASRIFPELDAEASQKSIEDTFSDFEPAPEGFDSKEKELELAISRMITY